METRNPNTKTGQQAIFSPGVTLVVDKQQVKAPPRQFDNVETDGVVIVGRHVYLPSGQYLFSLTPKKIEMPELYYSYGLFRELLYYFLPSLRPALRPKKPGQLPPTH